MSKTWCRISKEIQFDAGHRVPRHESKCRNLHGHRYRVVVHCRGTIVEEHDAADEGMLVDFGILKQFMQSQIHEQLDHGFIIYKHDFALMEAFGELQRFEPDFKHRIIEFPYVPTAENLARWCYDQLDPLVKDHFRGNLMLHLVEVHETPTSIAYYPCEAYDEVK